MSITRNSGNSGEKKEGGGTHSGFPPSGLLHPVSPWSPRKLF